MEKKIKTRKQKTGITLIALVLTIIVLLILAGITINLTIGEGGIIERAQSAGVKHEQAQAKEKLELVLFDLQADKLTKADYNENEYIENRLVENGMQVEGDIIVVDGWQFEIDRSVPKIATELEKLTKEDMLKPRVIKVDSQVDVNKIGVAIQLKNPEGTTMVYSIKEEGATEEIERSQSISDVEYTFENLQKGTTYEVTIQASNSYGSNTKTVKLTTQSPVMVSSINLSETEVTIYTNKTKELTYTIAPDNAVDKSVTWSSSNEAIAKVANGVITPVGSGECTVTCSSNDGGATATCKVTVVNAIGISTVTDLKAIDNNLAGNYVLLNDIDIAGANWTSLAVDPSFQFTGVLDGKGYSIKNLTNPLFGYISNATIKNIKFEDVAIVINDYLVGTIARRIGRNGNVTLSNIGVTGEIEGTSKVGGLVGYDEGGGNIISNCYVNANIKAETWYDNGGIVSGSSYTIEDCYFNGSVDGEKRSGPIINAANNANTTLSSNTKITDCYYNSDLCTINVPTGGGTGLKTSDFADATKFENWDFENTWVIKDGYPELRIFVK